MTANRPRLRLGLMVLAALACNTGCGFLDGFGSDGGTRDASNNSNGDGRMVGYGRPTLNITVGGKHYGPATPDPGAAAQLVNMRDGQGRIISSRFSLLGSVQNNVAACGLALERSGIQGISPIGVRAYFISDGSAATTPEGSVAPTGRQAVAVPEGTFACAAGGCGGGGLSITVLDASHVEGDLSGTWPDSLGRGAASVVCSFYLPLSVYQP